MPEKLKKSGAIDRKNREYGVPAIRSRTSHFANINADANAETWWLEVSYHETSHSVEAPVDLLLYDFRDDQLHHLRVPREHFRVHLSDFQKREDKKKIGLWLSAAKADRFRDQRSGVRFAQFFQESPLSKP